MIFLSNYLFYECRSAITGPRTDNMYFTFHTKGAFHLVFCVPNVVITQLIN